MTQQHLFEPTPDHLYDNLTKEEMVELLKLEEKLRIRFQNENARLKAEQGKKEQLRLSLEEQYLLLRDRIFGKSSEKTKKQKNKGSGDRPGKKRVRLPSKRFPNIDIKEIGVKDDTPPSCDHCGEKMSESGLKEEVERLTVIPKKYLIEKYLREKYKCKCCESLKSAKMPPQIVEGGSYSNELILDVSLSKYCDLIPIERYCEIAARQGLEGLSQNSMIEQTHHLANFLRPAYEKSNIDVFFSGNKQIKADETPHKMLEGSKKSNWYLWGFSTNTACYFESRDTRSGDVAWEHLLYSDCKFLLTDVYSGYKKAVRKANEYRKEIDLPPIISAYCNSHARRKFKDAEKTFKKVFEKEIEADENFLEKDESQFFINQYKRIYKLEKYVKKIKGQYPKGIKEKECYDKCLRLRRMMKKYFLNIREEVPKIKLSNSSKSNIGKAVRYFDKNYEGLTLCVDNPEIDIDNNGQERLFRSPVVGRKTWLGTHSERGAETASILFTLVEGAKLNKVNPRKYIKHLVEVLLTGGEAITPFEYAKIIKQRKSPPPNT